MSRIGFTLRPALRVARRKPLAVPLVLAGRLLPPRVLPERPIFIVGSPRSGTTLLFSLLRQAPGVAAMDDEGHLLWESYHHPRAKGWDAGARLEAEDVRPFEPRFLAWAIRVLAGKGRFIDKTPANVVRLPYLEALFPDAQYVFLLRDGRAVVSSMCVAWRTWPNPWYVVPGPFRVQGMPARHWRLYLVPGWRDLDGRSVEEIAARQYVVAVESMLRFRETLPEQRRVDLRYEDLVADPIGELGRVLGRLGLPFERSHREAVRATVRPPEPRKWRDRTREEVERVMPEIRPMLARTGYA